MLFIENSFIFIKGVGKGEIIRLLVIFVIVVIFILCEIINSINSRNKYY